MKTTKLILLTLIIQFFISTAANAVNVRQVCKETLDENSNLIFNATEYDWMLKQCMDKYSPRFETSNYNSKSNYNSRSSNTGGGSSALGIIFMFIFVMIVTAVLYIFIKAFIDTSKDSREGKVEEFLPGEGGNITGSDVAETWVHYDVFEVLSKDALIAIVDHLEISLPSIRQKSLFEPNKEVFLDFMGKERYEIFREKRPIAFVIYIELARRINRGDYGCTSDSNDSTDMTFNCDAFVKHMRDWKRIYKKLAKEGKVSEFSNELNSIEINLNATKEKKEQAKIRRTTKQKKQKERLIKQKEMKMILNRISKEKNKKNKPAKKTIDINNMKKPELINYAEKQGVIVKSNDTKAQIVDKLMQL
jgi:hypothetical protein